MTDWMLFELIGMGIGAAIVSSIWIGVETYRLRKRMKADREAHVARQRG